ncbi:hypothetical protein Q5752_002879 [Cryptotrichosporon argae]
MYTARGTRQTAALLCRGCRGYAALSQAAEAESSAAPHRQPGNKSSTLSTPSHPLAIPVVKSAALPTRLKKQRVRTSAQVAALLRAKDRARRIASAMAAGNETTAHDLPLFHGRPLNQTGETVPASSVDDAGETPSTSKPRTDGQPTLDDLLAKQRKRHYPPDAPKYAKAYERQHEAIMNAFVRKQVMQFAWQLEIPVSGRDSKESIVRRIMASWGWTMPRTPEKKSRTQKDIAVTQADLFLLNRDEEVIHDLRTRHSLNLTVARAGEGLVLRVAGNQAGVDHAERMLAVKRGARHIRRILAAAVHNFAPSAETLAAISGGSGAFIERKSDGSFELTGVTAQPLDVAQAMLQTAAERTLIYPHSRGQFLVGPSPTTALGADILALSPFLPAPSSAIPWDTGSALGGCAAWRAKQVAKYDMHPSTVEGKMREAKMGDAGVVPLSSEPGAPAPRHEADGEEQDGVTLRAACEAALEALPPSSTEATTFISLQFGHYVYPGSADTGPEALASPRPGRWRAAKSAHALAELSRPVFLPGLPPALIQLPLLNPPRRFRRLTYVAPQDGVRQAVVVERETVRGWAKELEQSLDALEARAEAVDQSVEAAETEAKAEAPTASDVAVREAASESLTERIAVRHVVYAETDVYLTERPIDARLTASSSSPLLDPSLPLRLAPALASDAVAPSSIEVPGLGAFKLERDEDVEITDSRGGAGGVIRTLKGRDTRWPGAFEYAELESTGPLDDLFWRELANVTRAVPPDAGAIRTAGGLPRL